MSTVAENISVEKKAKGSLLKQILTLFTQSDTEKQKEEIARYDEVPFLDITEKIKEKDKKKKTAVRHEVSHK